MLVARYCANAYLPPRGSKDKIFVWQNLYENIKKLYECKIQAVRLSKNIKTKEKFEKMFEKMQQLKIENQSQEIKNFSFLLTSVIFKLENDSPQNVCLKQILYLCVFQQI